MFLSSFYYFFLTTQLIHYIKFRKDREGNRRKQRSMVIPLSGNNAFLFFLRLLYFYYKMRIIHKYFQTVLLLMIIKKKVYEGPLGTSCGDDGVVCKRVGLHEYVAGILHAIFQLRLTRPQASHQLERSMCILFPLFGEGGEFYSSIF